MTNRLGLVLICLGVAVPTGFLAHGGGLNRYGCHNQRATGGYHCHRSGYTPRGSPRGAPPAKPARIRTLAPASGRGAISYSPSVPSKQPEKDLVLALEALLRSLGLNPGPVDGLIDSSTVTAIREFEANNGLPISGKFHPKLLAPLAEAASARR